MPGPREIYTEAEIRQLLAVCGESWVGARDRLAIAILWYTGLKTGELLRLLPGDFGHETISVSEPIDREIAVPVDRREELQALRVTWCDYRSGYPMTPASPLICGRSGYGLDSGFFRRQLAELSTAAGLRPPINAQGLRHTYAASLHAGGVPLRTIQRQLGHSDLGYTAAYVAALATSAPAVSAFRLE